MNIQHPSYLKALTFPRFLLASVVVVYHFGLHLPEVEGAFLGSFLQHGAVCVSFFFFLSGVVLSYNYQHKREVTVTQFWLKRMFRIYPLYILTFLLVYVFQLYITKDAPEPIFAVLNFFALQSWVVGHAMEVNFPSWSISVEFFFYLTFPLIVFLLRKLKYTLFVRIALSIVVLGWIQHYALVNYLWEPDRFYVEQFILYFPLFHLSTFVAGVLCGSLIDRLKKTPIHHLVYTLMAGLGIVAFVAAVNTDNAMRHYGHNGGLIPLFALICLGLSMDKTFFHRFFGWRPLVYLGEISYGVYMWQFPVYLWYTAYVLGAVKTPLTLLHFVLYFIVLVAVSTISYEFIEKPARKWLAKNWGR